MPSLKIRLLLLPIAAAAVVWFSCGSDPSTGDESADALIRWVRDNALILDTTDPGADPGDLEPLLAVVGDVGLVCLGESRHDVSEFFRMKHRVFRFLVERADFSVFVLEAGMPYCRLINRYIQGGDGDPEELLNGMGYWSIWDTEEMLALVRWMRAYNLDPANKKKLEFYGIDVMYPLAGIRETLDYVEAVDPGYWSEVQDRSFGLAVFDDLSWMETSNRLRALDESQWYDLRNNLALLSKRLGDRRESYVATSGETDYLWAVRNVQTAERAMEVFGALLAGDLASGGELRDLAMAGNLIWLRQHQFAGRRAVVWAHNAHISRSEFEMPDLVSRPVDGMGNHLATRYEQDMISVALLFGGGTYPADNGRDTQVFEPNGPGYLDGLLHRTGIGIFAVDLRPAPADGPAAGWLDRPVRLRAQDGDMVLTTRGAWDAVIFIDQITPTRPSRRAIGRLQAGRTGG
jgi:erythromycin esterase